MSRNRGVDTWRTLAALAVITIHTTPFEDASARIGTALDAATLINQLARFAVPFFYVVSGYYWANKVAQAGGQVAAPTLRMARRVAFLWIAWSVIYLLPFNIVDALAHGAVGPLKVVYWNITQAVDRPLVAVLEGTRPHLWFLVAWLWSAAICAVFVQRRWWRGLALVVAALYGLGLAGMAYAATPIGLRFDPAFRNGHFFAPAFFATGYYLHRNGVAPHGLRVGLVLAAVGVLVHLGEVALLHVAWGAPWAQDYAAGTYLLGVGVAMIGLSGAHLRSMPALAAIGPSVLGIYLVHVAFVELLQPLDRRLMGAPVWEMAYVVLVFAAALGTTRLLARLRWTRPLVS